VVCHPREVCGGEPGGGEVRARHNRDRTVAGRPGRPAGSGSCGPGPLAGVVPAELPAQEIHDPAVALDAVADHAVDGRWQPVVMEVRAVAVVEAPPR